jgi:hypothetical protein
MQARRFAVVLPSLLLCALATAAQMPMGQQAPRFRGVWKPVVGSGATYQVESRGEPKRNMDIAIVGAETAQGRSSHWLEMVFQDPQQGEIVMKNLVLSDGGNARVARMIMQTREMGAIEFSAEMMGMGGQRQSPQDADIRDDATLVGTETITVPAGTFECQHYRTKDGADVWVSEKVAPWGLVKMTSKDSSMVLTRTLTNVKTRVTGTPRKFDMSEMMRERPE